MYSDKIYNLVGGLIGFVLAPLSMLGLGTPFYLGASTENRLLIGWSFLAIALLILLCNVYLEDKRALLGHGASIFPAVFSLTAIPALLPEAVGRPTSIPVDAFDVPGHGSTKNPVCEIAEALYGP